MGKGLLMTLVDCLISLRMRFIRTSVTRALGAFFTKGRQDQVFAHKNRRLGCDPALAHARGAIRSAVTTLGITRSRIWTERGSAQLSAATASNAKKATATLKNESWAES
jgi:hypothetical protein